MTRNEIQNRLSTLLQTNQPLAYSHPRLIIRTGTIQLVPRFQIRPEDTVVCPVNEMDIRRGFSTHQWDDVTAKIQYLLGEQT